MFIFPNVFIDSTAYGTKFKSKRIYGEKFVSLFSCPPGQEQPPVLGSGMYTQKDFRHLQTHLDFSACDLHMGKLRRSEE